MDWRDHFRNICKVIVSLSRSLSTRSSVRNTGSYIIASPRIQKIYTDSDDFAASSEKFQKLGKRPMSFIDCVSLAHVDRRKIERIMSFDSEFDGIAVRIS
jgi:predicted nucleic acid-binding protein